MVVVKDMNKHLGDKKILKDISFHISEGEAVGLIGRNGAGKTTLLKVITGQLKEDSGFVRVNGCKNIIHNMDKLKEVAFISSERSQLWNDMKLIYSYDNCAKMYGIKNYKDSLMKLAEQAGITEDMDKLVNTLSLGKLMRAEIVYAMLTNPKLLIMDEALVGIDVSAKEDIHSILTDIKNNSDSTVIYTTHNLMEIEHICDRVIILDNGEIIFDGDISKIMKEYSANYTLHIDLCGKIPDMEDLPVEKITISNENIIIEYDKKKLSTAIILNHIINKCNCHIGELHVEEPHLEDIVRRIFNDRSEKYKEIL